MGTDTDVAVRPVLPGRRQHWSGFPLETAATGLVWRSKTRGIWGRTNRQTVLGPRPGFTLSFPWILDTLFLFSVQTALPPSLPQKVRGQTLRPARRTPRRPEQFGGPGLPLPGDAAWPPLRLAMRPASFGGEKKR